MSIEHLREQIDLVDQRLIELLGQRFAITEQIGTLKAQQQLAAQSADREAQQFARYSHLAAEFGVPEDLLRTIFRAVINQVIENHQTLQQQTCQPQK